MLVKLHDCWQVVVHRTLDGGSAIEKNFDTGTPIAWSMPVLYKLCDGDDCFPETWQDQHREEFERIVAAVTVQVSQELVEANNAWVIQRIRAGEPILTRTDIVGRPGKRGVAPFGSTHLDDLRDARRFPEPVIMAGKAVWLQSEVNAALARIAAEDTATPNDRIRPLNRHERRKAAKGC